MALAELFKAIERFNSFCQQLPKKSREGIPPNTGSKHLKRCRNLIRLTAAIYVASKGTKAEQVLSDRVNRFDLEADCGGFQSQWKELNQTLAHYEVPPQTESRIAAVMRVCRAGSGSLPIFSAEAWLCELFQKPQIAFLHLPLCLQLLGSVAPSDLVDRLAQYRTWSDSFHLRGSKYIFLTRDVADTHAAFEPLYHELVARTMLGLADFADVVHAAARDALLQAGGETFHQRQATRSEATDEPLCPTWDVENRVLRWGNVVIKRYKQPAENQTLLLAVFQKSNWAPIDDPLPPKYGTTREKRLGDTVSDLNEGLHVKDVIHFELDGTGRVRWVRFT